MSAHPPKIRRPWEPSDKTAVTSRLVPCPRPAGSAAKGRRLSHLVTKFETLGAVSSFDGTSALETQAPIPVKVVASHGNGGQESLTMSPSLSWHLACKELRLCHETQIDGCRETEAFREQLSPRQLRAISAQNGQQKQQQSSAGTCVWQVTIDELHCIQTRSSRASIDAAAEALVYTSPLVSDVSVTRPKSMPQVQSPHGSRITRLDHTPRFCPRAHGHMSRGPSGQAEGHAGQMPMATTCYGQAGNKTENASPRAR
ncbi:hypothetical protein G6O67_008694 [Ophiocordyceps sinensis]|uniref:Uncharacterized protein n=1 Tax=Ophiocordyceps sinensis TaxID=72228 RepID=A0A8H4LRS7_9HYPO|nr:hypothetical protein G6O67_008694 [Ophiocordyceps sinensis]